jgi:hypothetical protein
VLRVELAELKGFRQNGVIYEEGKRRNLSRRGSFFLRIVVT